MIHPIIKIDQDISTGAPSTPFTKILRMCEHLNEALNAQLHVPTKIRNQAILAIKCNGLGNFNLASLGGFRPRMLIKMDLIK